MNLSDLNRIYARSVKLGLIGLFLGAVGTLTIFFISHSLGILVFTLGFIIGIAGALLNFINTVNTVKADPNELFKAPKQPWEGDD